VTAYDIVVGIDGGETTGVAIFDIKHLQMFIGWEGTRHATCDMLADWETDTLSQILIAAERFRIGPKTHKLTPQQGTIKVNGAVEWVCHRRNWDYEEQGVKEAKDLSSDVKLKEMGLHIPTKGGHANDATRHCILAVERHLPSLLDDETLFGYNGRVKIIRRSTGS
jgi:hypothetical protein